MSNTVTRVISNDIYARKAIAEAQSAFSNYCKVKASPVKTGNAELTFQVKEEHLNNSREIILEFLNYALDRSVQLQQETS